MMVFCGWVRKMPCKANKEFDEISECFLESEDEMDLRRCSIMAKSNSMEKIGEGIESTVFK